MFTVVKIIILIALISFKVKAEDTGDFIIREQQNEFNLEKRNLELNDFENWKKGAESQEKENQTTKPKDENCFFIKEIEVEGNTVLSKREINKFKNSHANKKLCASEVQTFANDLSKLYISKGFITTLAFVKKQNLQSEKLVITVVEGRFEEVNFGRNSFKDSLTKFMVSGLQKGEVLNIKKIDQITDNLSNIPSLKYKTNLDAGSSSGLTKININGTKSFPIVPFFDYDNLGQESTGVNRYSGGLRADNILGLAESVNVKYTKSANAKTKESFSDVIYGGASVPFRTFKLSYNVSSSKYLSMIEGANQSFSSSGTSLMQTGTLQKVIFRNSKTKITLSTGLNLSDSKNYINDVLSNVQSRVLSSGEVSLLLNFYTPFGAFFIKPSFVKGLSILNGVKDIPNIKNTSPHAQFDMGKLYALYSVKINPLKTTFQTSFDGQFANTELYSQNQITVGGYYSVRGYNNLTIYGSSGYSWRNDTDFKLSDFTNTQFIKDFGFGFFADFGATSSPLNKIQKMAGAGYKLSFNKGNFNANLSVAYPLSYPEHFKEEIRKSNKPIIYLAAGFSV